VILERLHEALTARGRAAVSQVHAISGLGGIGKTQTAIEYAHRYRDEYTAIFRVLASSETDLNSGFAEIARILNLPQKDAEEIEVVVNAVRRWLETNRGWLLIFDNADDPSMVKPYVPREVKGHIIVTSRASLFDMLNIPSAIDLKKMEPDEARTFLFTRTARDMATADPGEGKAAEEIARELGYLPLALEQAAAFIAETAMPFKRYLPTYRKRGVTLLAKRWPVAGDYPESVATT